MLALIKPLVLTSLKSDKFKKFVVDLLEKLVEPTDNELDDRALQIVKKRIRHRMTDTTRVIPKKAAEESFNELHYLVTQEFLRLINVAKLRQQILKPHVIG